MKLTRTIIPIDSDEMAGIAHAEYERLFALLDSLTDSQWHTQTVCDDWDIHLMVAHLLGAAEANASQRESVTQLFRGRRWAKRNGRPEIDGINAVQVEDRRHLSPSELVERLRDVAPKAVRGRQRVPGPMRRMKVENPMGGTMTIGHLVDRVYTRDQWLHRVDISMALGRDIHLTADHDGRIIEDVVEEWVGHQGESVTLDLTGPAGGLFTDDAGGRLVTLDAVEFALITSGRKSSDLGLSLVVY